MKGKLINTKFVSVTYAFQDSPLKGVWHKIFELRFFSWISVPQTHKYCIPLGPFWIFSKIRGDIRELMFIASVNDTGEKMFSGVNDTGKKFFIVDTGQK